MNVERPEHIQSHSRDLNTDGPDAEAQAGAFFRNQTAHRLHSQQRDAQQEEVRAWVPSWSPRTRPPHAASSPGAW